MPFGLIVLHVPKNPEEVPQFVRLAHKGLNLKVVFLHPNGELYKVPQYSELKGHQRNCGPQTAPVFGGAKRTCEGGCCGWFTATGGGHLDKLEVYDFLDFADRPGRDIFLVRHGVDGETDAKEFMDEGLRCVKKDAQEGDGGRGYLGNARFYR